MSTVHIDCICPPRDGEIRHPDGDNITLRDRLGFRAVEAIRTEVSIFGLTEPDAAFSDTLAIFSEGYVLHGIESWTLEEDGPKGKPEPIAPSRANIRAYILDNVHVADVVSTAADAIYAEAVILPLLTRASSSSPGTPTPKSTSRKPRTSAKRQTPSKPSSTTTTPTADIVRITVSQGGDSNSSPSSESAA